MANSISPKLIERVYKLLTGNKPYYHRAKYGRIFSDYHHNGSRVILRRRIDDKYSRYATIDFLVGKIQGYINDEKMVLTTKDAKNKEFLGAIKYFYETFGDYDSYKSLPQYNGLLVSLKEHMGEIIDDRIVKALDTIMDKDVPILIKFI